MSPLATSDYMFLLLLKSDLEYIFFILRNLLLKKSNSEKSLNFQYLHYLQFFFNYWVFQRTFSCSEISRFFSDIFFTSFQFLKDTCVRS